MVKDSSQLFVAGPPVVERGIGHAINKEDLGGSHIHAHGSGAVDNEVDTEDEAFEMIRRYLSYMPQNVWQLPARATTSDSPNRREEELVSIIPKDKRRTFDVRRVLDLIVDQESFFEIAPGYGTPLVTGLARLDGYSIGVMANDSREQGRRGRCRSQRKNDSIRRYVRHVSHTHRQFRRQPRFSHRT